jgi:hypothetical protein
MGIIYSTTNDSTTNDSTTDMTKPTETAELRISELQKHENVLNCVQKTTEGLSTSAHVTNATVMSDAAALAEIKEYNQWLSEQPPKETYTGDREPGIIYPEDQNYPDRMERHWNYPYPGEDDDY